MGCTFFWTSITVDYLPHSCYYHGLDLFPAVTHGSRAHTRYLAPRLPYTSLICYCWWGLDSRLHTRSYHRTFVWWLRVVTAFAGYTLVTLVAHTHHYMLFHAYILAHIRLFTHLHLLRSRFVLNALVYRTVCDLLFTVHAHLHTRWLVGPFADVATHTFYITICTSRTLRAIGYVPDLVDIYWLPSRYATLPHTVPVPSYFLSGIHRVPRCTLPVAGCLLHIVYTPPLCFIPHVAPRWLHWLPICLITVRTLLLSLRCGLRAVGLH